MCLGLFERGETRLVSRLLSPGDVFIDVGAHIGGSRRWQPGDAKPAGRHR
jgi:hypothetical protein